MTRNLIYLFSVMCWLPLQSKLISQGSNTKFIDRGFNVDLVAGLNFSQLDGDGTAGYRHIGLRAGTQISYALSPTYGTVLGLFYEEKGSSSNLTFLSKDPSEDIHLQYVSIPVGFYKDTGYRKAIDRHRLRIQMEVSISRLFDISIGREDLMDSKSGTFDISPSIGFTYHLTRRSGMNLRIEQSFTNILDVNQGTDQISLRSYLMNIQYLYRL